ncbi:MAG TPA: ABC transporter substrate-binding protein [Virgibacillus sp.]|nr:ABC transporter substrate-binding protein [Virgibacillus sp.]
MKRLFKNGLFLMLLALLLVAVGCNSESSSTDANNGDDQEEVASGGTLNVAMDAPPPTLDQPTSTAVAARDTSRLLFETLVTTDSKHQAVPMLAESIDTDDNQIFTFHLREGVKFHNGEEMTADDVVASMERWLEKSTITGNIFNDATWTAEDEYTVVLELIEPSSLTLDTLASAKQAAAIMPKEIVESAPADGVEEYIGTGPFKFVEWKQDQYIHFTKYEDYQAVEEEADGLAGKKEALVDDIYFHLVPDTSTRVAGLQTGEYDFAFGIPYDNYEQFENDDNFETILTPSANEIMGYNNVEGIASDFEIREVVNMALDADEIMMAAFPNEEFYWLDSGYMDVHIENWASTAGSEYHNQNNPDRAKEMLEEIGYDGEEFKIMTTRDYDHHYNVGVVIHEQLQQIGMNAELVVYDWPTMLDKRENELDAWDVFITSSSTVSTPPQLLALSPTWAGGVNDDHVGDLMEQIEKAPSIEEAQELWDELQLYAWEELLPVINFGGYHSLYAHSTNVSGITTTSGPIFWNVTVSE